MSYYTEENQWGERYIPDVNRETFQTEPSCAVFERELDLDLAAKDTLHVVVGSDSGLMFRYLEDNLMAPGSCAIVVDVTDLLPYLEQHYTQFTDPVCPQEGPAKVRLFKEADWQNADIINTYNPWFFKRTIQVHQAYCCFIDYNNHYVKLFRDTRRLVAERQIKLGHALGLKSFTKAQFQNAADNVMPFLQDREFGKCKVAVVLGGGPSLDEHMEWLQKNRHSLFLIAVSRLCKKLSDLELKPDVVVSVDPMENMYEVSKHGVLWNDVPLINSYHLSPHLLQQWQGPHYYIGRQLPWHEFSGKEHDGVTSTGPTVSHTAVIVASYLGFSTILMAGVDLCYSAIGGTHVKGTPEAALRSLPSGYDAQVTTYSGRTAGTNMALLRSIESMALLGKTLNHNSSTLYSLSKEAVHIDSIPLIDRQAVTLPESRPLFDCSRHWAPTISSLSELASDLIEARRAFRDIAELSRKALDCIDHIYGRNGTPAHHKRLQKLETRLKKFDIYVKTIKHYDSHDFVKLQTPAGFQQMDKAEMENWARSYYSLHKKGASSILSWIDSALGKVELRKREIAPEASAQELLDAWAQDNTPGRVLRYLSVEAPDLEPEQRLLLEDAQKRYVATLCELGKPTERYLTDQGMIINDCLNSVIFLFHSENSDELQTLSTMINADTWPNDALIKLIEGLSHELLADNRQAIALYKDCVDLCRMKVDSGCVEIKTVARLIETGLLRQTQCHLSNKDGQQAVMPLYELSTENHHYMCSCARLLDLIGQTEMAIQQVQIYLQLCPNDWRAAQQMAGFYQTIGAHESAELALQLVSSIREQSVKPEKEAA
ncbi:MAG: 6-hydroxymethylpterin diphosphokinase MptE-like protein [Granulosicoccus sp.]